MGYQERSQLDIPVATSLGNTMLHVVAVFKSLLYEGDASDIAEGLEKYQLEESGSYQYQFDPIDGHDIQFATEDNIVSFSKLKGHRGEGTFRTGIFVGTYKADVCDASTSAIVGKVKLEIRSVKTNYVSDYRDMLSDIADAYTDLVLQQGSPVTQHLEVNEDGSSQTLYQRFCFVRGIIESDAFCEAMHKIMSAPVKKWTDATCYRPITGIRRLTRRNMREIASSNDRIPWGGEEKEHYNAIVGGTSYGLRSLPRRLLVDTHEDSIDNAANQFVKFALRQFEMFCSDIGSKANATERLRNEAAVTRERLLNYLDSSFFRLVSDPSHLSLNSPVLQRKEGYREVFQKWLLFDIAAKLNWTGGEDVYEAGKKDVATLYEYWLFFKLKDLISNFFSIDPVSLEKLVQPDEGDINLSLRRGHTTVIRGVSNSDIRKLNVAFYYNRTFGKVSSEAGYLHKAGSWTLKMRPDYTLSIWPGDMKEEEAEKLDLITHIHFDAKYRLKQFLSENNNAPSVAEGDEDDNLTAEKEEQAAGIYKNADILKMHAYKDAIRRTSGAYVLYPGSKNDVLKGFHEVLPGLGAFHVRPGNWEEDSEYLKKFLSEVKAHMLDRTSEREKLSYFRYDVLREPNAYTTRRKLPELDENNRDFLPDSVSVIVAYLKSPEHLEWIMKNGLYNMRAGSSMGSMSLSPMIINARYVLLHDGEACHGLMKIDPKEGGPKVRTLADLKAKTHYPTDKKDDPTKIYLVYKLMEVEDEMTSYYWDVDKKWGKKPMPMTLSELLRVARVRR